jgi:hypothetical protein
MLIDGEYGNYAESGPYLEWGLRVRMARRTGDWIKKANVYTIHIDTAYSMEPSPS